MYPSFRRLRSMPIPLVLGGGFILLCLGQIAEQFKGLPLATDPALVQGQLVDSYQDTLEDGQNRTGTVEIATYEFFVGRERYTTTTTMPAVGVRQQVMVEYSEADPHIARVEGDGPSGLGGVLLRVVGFLGLIGATVAWLVVGSRPKPQPKPLTLEEVEELTSWEPEPPRAPEKPKSLW